MSKLLNVSFIFFMFVIFPSLVFGQTVQIQEVNKGCTFTWIEPMVDNPNSPGEKIGAWELEADLAGFKWVTNDELVWDELKMQRFNDPTQRSVTCSEVGVEAVQDYFVMIRAFDTSDNESEFTSLAFRVVLEDQTPPSKILEFCLNGNLNGNAAKFCSTMNPPPPGLP